MSFDEMNKEQLRAACKAAGIKYGSMNNAGMRDALKALEAQAAAEETGQTEDDLAEEQSEDEVQTTEIKTQPAPAAQVTEDTPAPSPRPKVVGEVVQSKSLKIEKGRPSSNGVTKPSVGSICRAVWDALDAKRAESGEVSFEDVRNLMKANSWQRNTAFTQFQRWKQFNGIMPRTGEADAE